jgi:hypothetical protein
MYQIDKERNRIKLVNQTSFSELGFKEREHLQEWIAYKPNVFGEDLLIIQKEFAGFDETNERLDLLALDKRGNLVIIENKLDDSGRDVTWQSLKYASYCSNLSKSNIREIYQEYLNKYFDNENAESNLVDFFENQEYEDLILNHGSSQRIILVASKYRKEVTATVLWLMNYKLSIQCFKVTPYSFNSELFINFEQIIPTKDAEEYMIGMAKKAQDEIQTQSQLKNRHVIRREFWKYLLEKSSSKTDLFKNISPSQNNWIGTGSGVRGVPYNFVASNQYARVEIYIDRGDKEINKYIFDSFQKQQSEIEEKFGNPLVWERLDQKRASRIKFETNGNISDREQWGEMSDFMINSMIKLEKTFNTYMAKINLDPKIKTT